MADVRSYVEPEASMIPTRGLPGAASSTSRRRQPGLVTIVLPARNEEQAMADTLRSLPFETLRTMGFEAEVVILDGQSEDRTRDIAYGQGGAVVVLDRERGKGNAVRHARARFRGDFVVMLDADGTYAADALPQLLEPLAWNDVDVVMGRRIPQANAMSFSHAFGNTVLSGAASVLYGRLCRDLCTGLWGFRAAALQRLPLQARWFELEAELFALACRHRLRIGEVPVDYLPRQGTSKLSTRDAGRIAFTLLRSRVMGLPPPALRPPSFVEMSREAST
jgi:dolichol-phosphate hexosyltransferase